jgi:DnaJ-class molecular chaperone
MNEEEIDDSGLAPGDEAAPGQPGSGENVCPQCNGSGVASSGVTCPNCEGTGTVTEGIGGG